MSRQSINYQKSGMMFSSNVRLDKQRELSDIFQVHNDTSSDQYLRLLSLVGRSKRSVFGFIKERVCKRVQTWEAETYI